MIFPDIKVVCVLFFFSSRRRHTRCLSDWSSDVCSSDLRNPWNPELVTGGSSGGSAAAVAAGLAPLALGSDTGGSIRQPASLCGVFGAMGTYGRVSRRGLIAFGSSLDRIGPLARSAGDAALALELMSGGDAGDATTVHRFGAEWAPELAAGGVTAMDGDVRRLRVGILRTAGGVDPSVDEACASAIDVLRSAGANTLEVDLPASEHGVAVY